MDQFFSQTAALLARHEFGSPSEVVDLLDSAFRPDDLPELRRKQEKTIKVRTHSCRMDNVADWKGWVAALGIRLLGLRTLLLSISVFVFCC